MERDYDDLPVNIERLREEWKREGIYPSRDFQPPAARAGESVLDGEPIEVAAVFAEGFRGLSDPATEASMEMLRREVQLLRETFAQELARLRESYQMDLHSLKGLTLDLASMLCDYIEETRKKEAKRPWYRFRRK